MNLTLLLDNKSAHDARHLDPHKSMLDINMPRGVSRIAALPSPVVTTISNWLSYPREGQPSPEKVAFLNQLAD